MAYQINLTGQEIDERLQNIGTAEDVAAADGTLYARISKNADDVDELRDAVGHIDFAQTATDKTVTQHTADISTLQTALKTKANLANGKVPANELPIVTSLKQDDYTTIPSAKLVDEALTAVGNTLEEKINNKVVGLLHWQGVKSTTSEIKSITSAKKGDVWHSNGDGSEWVCTQDITAANADAWTELGTPVNLSGYYTKTEVDKKVKPLADSIGSDSDAASANGSLYARIKKNATDIYDYASKMSSGTLRDLYISAGAKYNEATGYYELNGLTDITEEEMRVIYKYAGTPQVRGAFAYSKARTNLPMSGMYNGWLCGVMFYGCLNLEVAYLGNRQSSPTYYDEPFIYSEGDNCFYLCQKLKKIYGRIYQRNTWSLMFGECLALEEVRIAELYSSIQLSWSPNLSKESVQYMITNANPPSGAAAGSIAITLYPTAYARLKDDADIVAALEAKGGIVTLVSA